MGRDSIERESMGIHSNELLFDLDIQQFPWEGLLVFNVHLSVTHSDVFLFYPDLR
jgi:hypothetical protein